jgi:hypothetical protein
LLEEAEIELIEKEWLKVLHRPWPVVSRSTGREKKSISDESIQLLNSTLCNLHEVVVMEFLKVFGTIQISHGLFSHLIKGKMILYQLLSGESSTSIPGIEYSTYRRLYKEVWLKNSAVWSNWCGSWMEVLSTPEIRMLYSRVHSPELFKTVTMFIDSKDFVTILNDLRAEKRKTRNNKSTLISRKNGWKHAGKIVFLDDIKMNPIAQSRMWGANERYDGKIMSEMKIYKYMNPDYDCLIFDHHFDSEVTNIIEEANEKGINLSLANFSPNLKGASLSPGERHFKESHSAFRSKQETERNTIPNTFKCFSSTSQLRCVDFEVRGLQIKVCNILLAIHREIKRHPSVFASIVVRWKDKNFDFPIEEIDLTSPAVSELVQRSDDMKQKQLTKILALRNKKLTEEETGSELDIPEPQTTIAQTKIKARGRPRAKLVTPPKSSTVEPAASESPRCSPKKRKQIRRLTRMKKRKID